ILVLAVDAFLHALQQQAAPVLLEQAVPARAPQHLDDVPTGATENALELLDNLAVATNRPVKTLEIAIDDKDQVVELLATRKRDGAERLRLIRFAVAHEGPDLAIGGFGELVVLQILQESGLIDRHQRPEPHRHGRKLPEIRHQPGVRIARQAFAAGLLPEIENLFLAQPSLEKGARVDPGRAVTLDENQIAAMSIGRRM